VIYPTAGFFTNPQILAVGAVRPDGSFTVQLPARVPVDLLAKSSSQCATLRSSNPKALTTFTGDSLLYQHGTHLGDTHSGSTFGIASFTSFATGNTRSGFLYANRPHHSGRLLPADHHRRRRYRPLPAKLRPAAARGMEPGRRRLLGPAPRLHRREPEAGRRPAREVVLLHPDRALTHPH
jgi:hypothetical protein